TAAELGAEPVQPVEALIEGPAEMVPIVLVESAQSGSSIAKEDDERSFLKLLRNIVTPARAGMVFQDDPGHPQANDQDAEASSGVREGTEAEDGHGSRSSAHVASDELDFRFDNPKTVVTPQPVQIEVLANPNQAQTKGDGSDQVEAGVAIEASA